MEINKYIDHTLLKRDATSEDLDKFIADAKKYNFATVCTFPIWIEYLKKGLEGTDIGITAVFGFPFGTQTIETKVFEAKDAIAKGATELDMVITVSKIHERDEEYLRRELTEVRKATEGTIIKVIFENALLSKEEISWISEIASSCGWDFIKTSTGIGCEGATFEDVETMVRIANGRAQVKAAGGVRTYDDAVKMIELGATRIGTSNGVDIIEGKPATAEY